MHPRWARLGPEARHRVAPFLTGGDTHCGAPLAVCAHGRCTTRFPERPHYPECGKPAVACDVERRWPVCAEHVEETRP
jgi:hypothetical protein